MKTKPTYIHKVTITSLLLLTSPLALAATGDIPWTGWLLIIVTVSLIAAFILSRRNKSEESLPVKLIFGGMYFWVITFIQLTVLSLVYQLSN